MRKDVSFYTFIFFYNYFTFHYIKSIIKLRKLTIIIIALLVSLGVVTTSVFYFRKKNDNLIVNPLKKYKITFEGLKKEYKKEISENDLLVKPNDKDMEKQGFIFIGWKEDGKNEYFDFSTPIKKDLILKPQYHSLEILEKAKSKLRESEKIKYTDESISKLETAYTTISNIINDSKVSNFEKETLLVHLEDAFNKLVLKDNNNPIVPPVLEKVRVTFELDGGVLANNVIEVEKGSKVTKPTNPTKDGYNFLGWFVSNEQNSEKFDFETQINENTTIYAKWEMQKPNVENVTLTLDLQGGKMTGELTITVEKGHEVNKPTEIPTKEGYKFVKWVTEVIGDTEYQFDVLNANTTIYAKYEKQELTINLNPGDGILTSEAQNKVMYGEKATKPTEPTKEGHTFKGWFKEQTFENEFVFETELVKTNLELFAKFEINKVSITFDVDGNTTTIAKQEVNYGSIINKPNDPVKTGYTFKKWVTQANGDVEFDFNTEIKENITLYAKFEINHYTVSFNVGVDVNPIASQEVNYNEKAQKPANPEKDGHTFGGWYKENTYTTEFNFDTENIINNIELFAKFEINKYMVTFEVEGNTTQVQGQEITHGQMATKPSQDPEKPGLIFFGWVLNELNPQAFDFENTPITSDLVLKAYFESERFSVTFVLKEDETLNTSARIKVKENQKVTRPVKDPVKENHRFENWYKNDDLTEIFDFDQEVITHDTMIYPKFERTHAFVNLNLLGSTIEGQELKIKAEINKTISEPKQPTKEGHTFKGWYKEENGTTKFDFNTENITEDIELFAIFEINKYEVSFELDGSTSNIQTQTINHGQKATKPENPEKVGYTFKKWVTQANGNEEFDFNNPITQTTVVYAKFEINKYSITFNTNTTDVVVESQEVVYNQKANEPSQPQRDGLKFLGWYVSNEENAEKFNFDTLITENKELFAIWEINVYTITFNIEDNETQENPQKVNHGQMASRPINKPLKENYTFIDWVTQKDGSEVFDFSQPVTKSQTIYAKFEINKYRVVFDVEGVTDQIQTQEIAHGSMATKPQPDPIKEGHTFKGWFATKDGTKEYEFDKNSITGNLTLYAKFEINEYTFNFYNDTVIFHTAKATHGSYLPLPRTAPQKTGHKFKAWTITKDGNDEVDYFTKVSKNLDLYAKFELNKYTVTYEITDGKLEEGQASSIQVSHGFTIDTAPNVIREHYTVSKWIYSTENKKDVDFIFGTTKVEDNMTIKPVWEKKKYTLTFDPTKGELDTNQEKTVEVTYNESHPVYPSTKQLAGYTLKYWSFEEDGIVKKFDFGKTPVTSNLTLKDIWQKINITVLFIIKEGEDSKNKSKQLTANGTTSPKVEDLTEDEKNLPGEVFKKWILSNQDKDAKAFDFETEILDDIVLKAVYYDITPLKEIPNLENDSMVLTEGKIIAKPDYNTYIISVKNENDNYSDIAVNIVGPENFTDIQVGKKVRVFGKFDNSTDLTISTDSSTFLLVEEDNSEEFEYRDYNENMTEEDFRDRVLNIKNAVYLRKQGHEHIFRVGNKEIQVYHEDSNFKFEKDATYNFEKILFLRLDKGLPSTIIYDGFTTHTKVS